MQINELGPSQMDEIRGTGKETRKAYSPQEYFHFSKRSTAKKNLVASTLTESQGPRNEEVRHLWRSLQGGYVGLMVAMISVAIVAILFAKVYLTPTPPPPPDSFQPMTASGTPATTGIEQMRANVDAASAIQGKLNQHNTETNKALGE